MLKKISYFITGMIITIAVAAAVFLGAVFIAGPAVWPLLPVFGDVGGKVVAPGAVLKKENSYLCGDVELVFQGQAPGSILGKNLRDLRGKYPESEGWSVDLDNEKLVVLRKKMEGFCSQHSHYRHLGVHNGRLAVYQGPLGFDQKLLRVEENKKINLLPQSMREKLQKAGEFDRLPPEEKSALRGELEFIDEVSLNSALENLDELSR
ncbi:MAG: hypothetical protein ACOY30_04290 [Bacillota bacterium]